MTSSHSGFTLVEIAIVLVIVGLLLGGILKGQELIVQARIKNIANDFNGIATANYAYQDRYRRLPGDDPGANRWTVAGSALAGGNGNGTIGGKGYESSDDNDENRKFWLHLRLAGLIIGPTDTVTAGSAQPANAVGGIVGIQQGGLGLSGPILCSGSLPAKIAQAIDTQLDDGDARTGAVRATAETAPPTAIAQPAALSTTNGTPTANYLDNGTNLYVVCRGL